jgi:very-short-patch-repair endonuclease
MAANLIKNGIVAVPQYPFGPYTIDFAIPDYRIAIECDGDYWHSLPQSIARDKRKDKFINGKGWLVLRFTETRLTTDLSSCVRELLGLILDKAKAI